MKNLLIFAWTMVLVLFLGTAWGQTNTFPATGNVGIGTPSPNVKLHVNAPEKNALRIYREDRVDRYLNIWHGTSGGVIEPIRNNGGTTELFLGYDAPTNVYMARNGGNVGIGTTTPNAKLHVNAPEKNALRIYREDRVDRYLNIWHGTSGGVIEPIRNNGGTTELYLGYDAPTNVYMARNGGNVGIGTTTPTNKLDVNGTARAKEILVEEGWGDYVFQADYQLPTLAKEAQHIQEKGHLSGFQSAEEMNGEIQLGDVTKRQQVKIEEMMLHIIKINERLEQLEKENAQLKSKAGQ